MSKFILSNINYKLRCRYLNHYTFNSILDFYGGGKQTFV